MIIEPANKKDFARIAEIYNSAHKPFQEIYSDEELKNDFQETEKGVVEMSETRIITVVKNNSEILGYAAYRVKNSFVVWISSLYVDPNFQNQGIGAGLLEHIEIFTKNKNCILVALETHAKATWAISFYEKNGYQIVNDILNRKPYSYILEKLPVANRPILAKNVS